MLGSSQCYFEIAFSKTIPILLFILCLEGNEWLVKLYCIKLSVLVQLRPNLWQPLNF